MTSHTKLGTTHTHTLHRPVRLQALGVERAGGGEEWVKAQQNELTLDYNHEFINLICLNS